MEKETVKWAVLRVWKFLKPVQSLLINLTLMFCYVVLEATIFVNVGIPLEFQRQQWAYAEVQSDIDAHADGIVKILNWTRFKYSDELIRLDQVELRDKIFASTGFTANESKWGTSEAAIHSLCLMTAIGSCVTTPPTTTSRSIGILYGMLGLPLAVMTIGNVGKYLGRGAAYIVHFVNNKLSHMYKSKGKPIGKGQHANEARLVDLHDDKIPRATFKLVLAKFLMHLPIGAAVLPEFKGENFLSAMYLCFVSLTTVTNIHAYATLIYFLFGMALTTVALEVAGNYLRKVHFMGRKLRDACSVAIHSGGKDLSVSELLSAFGRQHGIADDIMLKSIVHMDKFVSITIVRKETGELRKPNILVIKTVSAENLGIPDILFADDRDSDI